MSAGDGGNLSTVGVTVGTGATLIAAASIRRKSLTVQNNDAAAIFIGPSTVTVSGATRGLSIPAAGSLQDPLEEFTGPLFAISAAGTAANAVCVLEVFG